MFSGSNIDIREWGWNALQLLIIILVAYRLDSVLKRFHIFADYGADGEHIGTGIGFEAFD